VGRNFHIKIDIRLHVAHTRTGNYAHLDTLTLLKNRASYTSQYSLLYNIACKRNCFSESEKSTMKFTIVTVSLSALVAFAAADTCASLWGQCGGKNYKIRASIS
jgi:hypothetical protein